MGITTKVKKKKKKEVNEMDIMLVENIVIM